MVEDAELLRRFAEGHAEADFAEFVRRYVDFVYGCALRRVGGDVHFAEDVVQQVFVAAARNARGLARHPAPSGWLYTAARNISVQLVRTERRRRTRERAAEAMSEQNGPIPEGDWDQVRPVLDDALDDLNEADRQAVLVRFFEGKSFAEVGARLRVAENAARMRVDRALDKLHAALVRRGVTSTTAALALVLANQAGVAAPMGLATAATGAALATTAGTTAGAVLLMGMTKLQVAVASAVLLAAGSSLVLEANNRAVLRREWTDVQAQVDAAMAVRQKMLHDTAARNEALAAARGRVAELTKVRAQIDLTYAELRRYQASRRTTPSSAGPLAGRPGMPLPAETATEPGLPDAPPKIANSVPPKYPVELRRLGLPGEATIDFIVGADGRAHQAYALTATHPAIADAAVAAIEQWTFQPGRKGGKSIPAHMQVPVVFKISDDEAPSPEPERSPADLMPAWF